MIQTTLSRVLSRIDGDAAAIAFSVLFGATLLFVAGFADAEMLHAAAHDGRHSVSFPCH